MFAMDGQTLPPLLTVNNFYGQPQTYNKKVIFLSIIKDLITFCQ